MNAAPSVVAVQRPREFDCRDCGAHVFAFGEVPDPLPTRCGVCSWIREFVQPFDRGEVRSRYYDTEQWRHWVTIGAYRDESYAERRCDHCGKPYRGPAVFCCLGCVEAAA
jgi:hypothetical protein